MLTQSTNYELYICLLQVRNICINKDINLEKIKVKKLHCRPDLTFWSVGLNRSV